MVPATVSASTIVYNCGTSVCMIDPDVIGAKPTTLGAGRSAGITPEGERMAWITPTGAVVTAGDDGKWKRGSITPAQPIGDRPLMRNAWGYKIVYSDPVTDAAGNVTGRAMKAFTYDDRNAIGNKVGDYVNGGTAPIITLGATSTHGAGNWAPMATLPFQGKQSLCNVSFTSTYICGDLLYQDDAEMAYPAITRDGLRVAFIRVTPGSAPGNPTGQLMVAAVGKNGSAEVVSANPSNGMMSFSMDGKALAVERQGKIYVIDIATKKERLVATGTYPQWGGKRTAGTTAAPAKKAKKPKPSPRAIVVGSRLPYAGGKITVSLRCPATTACRGTLQIKSGKTVLASRVYVVGARKTTQFRLTPTKAGRDRLATVRTTLSAAARITPKNGRAAAKSVTIAKGRAARAGRAGKVDRRAGKIDRRGR